MGFEKSNALECLKTFTEQVRQVLRDRPGESISGDHSHDVIFSPRLGRYTGKTSNWPLWSPIPRERVLVLEYSTGAAVKGALFLQIKPRTLRFMIGMLEVLSIQSFPNKPKLP